MVWSQTRAENLQCGGIVSVDQAYKYKQITSSVSTAGVLTEQQLKELGSEEYKVVICLLPSDSEYAINGERSIVEDQDIKYVYIPVDFAAPTEEDYQKFAAEVIGLSGKKAILHCAANYRVTAFYGIYANQELGWSKNQVWELISSIWDISEYPVWNDFVASRIG